MYSKPTQCISPPTECICKIYLIQILKIWSLYPELGTSWDLKLLANHQEMHQPKSRLFVFEGEESKKRPNAKASLKLHCLVNISNPTSCTPNFAAQAWTESKDSSNTHAPINIKIKTPTQRQMMWSWLGNTDSLQQTGPACYLLNPWHFESMFGINALEGIQHLRAGGLESSTGLWLAGLVSESLPVRGTCLQPKWDPPFPKWSAKALS